MTTRPHSTLIPEILAYGLLACLVIAFVAVVGWQIAAGIFGVLSVLCAGLVWAILAIEEHPYE